MKLSLISKYVYYLLIALVVLAIGITLFFLYEYFYRTLIQAKVVYVLKSQVAYKIIDTHLWNQVKTKFDNKKTSKINSDVIVFDPFKGFVEVSEE